MESFDLYPFRKIKHLPLNSKYKIDEVAECYNILGDFDFLLKVQVRDMKHYQDFVFNKLGSVDSIGSTHSTFVMAEVKNTHELSI